MQSVWNFSSSQQKYFSSFLSQMEVGLNGVYGVNAVFLAAMAPAIAQGPAPILLHLMQAVPVVDQQLTSSHASHNSVHLVKHKRFFFFNTAL